MRLVRAMLIFTFLAFGLLAALYYQSQREPAFYATAMVETPEKTRQQSVELETRVLDLYNAILVEGPWRGELNEQQINGWLANGLSDKFPDLLPRGITQPRVAFAQDKVSIACRSNFKGFSGVVVGEFDLFCTDQKDQLAIRIRGIHAGVIPIPIRSFIDQIDQQLQKAGFATQWSELEGDPVLTVDIPEKFLILQDIYRVELSTIDFADQTVTVSGQTIDWAYVQAQQSE